MQTPKFRFGDNKEIDLISYLPTHFKETEIETFIQFFQDYLNELYKGTHSLSISSIGTYTENLSATSISATFSPGLTGIYPVLDENSTSANQVPYQMEFEQLDYIEPELITKTYEDLIWANGSIYVSGSNTDFLSNIVPTNQIRLSADGEPWQNIYDVIDDETIQLISAWSGSTPTTSAGTISAGTTEVLVENKHISILEKIKRLTEFHDPDLIDIDYIQYFADYLGYNIKLNVDNLVQGIPRLSGDTPSTAKYDEYEKEKYLRLIVSNLPNWYKIKGTTDAVKILLYSFGLISDVYKWYSDVNYRIFISEKISEDEGDVTIPTDYVLTPHFSIKVEGDTSLPTYTTDQINNILNAIDSIRPINTVFHGLSVWFLRRATIYVHAEPKTNLYISLLDDTLSWESSGSEFVIAPNAWVDGYNITASPFPESLTTSGNNQIVDRNTTIENVGGADPEMGYLVDSQAIVLSGGWDSGPLGNYIKIANFPPTTINKNATTDFTLEYKFNVRTFTHGSGGNNISLGFIVTAGNESYEIKLDQDLDAIGVYYKNGPVADYHLTLTSNLGIVEGEDCVLHIVKNIRRFYIYLNGILMSNFDQNVIQAAMNATYTEFRIGADDVPTQTPNMNLYWFCKYNRALSTSEILNNATVLNNKMNLFGYTGYKNYMKLVEHINLGSDFWAYNPPTIPVDDISIGTAPEAWSYGDGTADITTRSFIPSLSADYNMDMKNFIYDASEGCISAGPYVNGWISAGYDYTITSAANTDFTIEIKYKHWISDDEMVYYSGTLFRIQEYYGIHVAGLVGNFMEVSYNNNAIWIEYGDTGGTYDESTTTINNSATRDDIVYLTIVKEGDIFKMFVNGEEATYTLQQSISAIDPKIMSCINIGAMDVRNEEPFEGAFYWVAFYNRKLSLAEIKKNYLINQLVYYQGNDGGSKNLLTLTHKYDV